MAVEAQRGVGGAGERVGHIVQKKYIKDLLVEGSNLMNSDNFTPTNGANGKRTWTTLPSRRPLPILTMSPLQELEKSHFRSNLCRPSRTGKRTFLVSSYDEADRFQM